MVCTLIWKGMEIDMKKLLDQLKQDQSKYPPAQRTVAAFIVKHYREIPFMTISDIAAKLEISETTISKFCDTLGYSGFSGLKKKIAEFVNSEITITKKLNHTVHETENSKIYNDIIEIDTANIRTTLQNTENHENVEKMVELINNAENIYILGTRISSTFASYLTFKLRQQGYRAISISMETGDFVDQMLVIRPTDLVIAFSFFRYTQATIDKVQLLHERNVPIALITDDKLSPAYEYASAVLSCESNEESFIVSYAGCVSLLNALLTINAMKHKADITEHSEQLEHYFHQCHVYYE